MPVTSSRYRRKLLTQRSAVCTTNSNTTANPIFTQMLSNLQKIRYSRMLWSEDVISLNKKISDILSQVQFLTQLQQAGGVDPDTFISSNNKLSEQLRRLKQEKARLLDTDSDDLADRTRDLMDALEDGPDFLDSFDAELFDALVEKIIVDSNERLRFRLKNGLELTRANRKDKTLMGNRKLPFGYQMRMGEIVRNEPEAKAVQDIFLQYTLGASLKEIAEQMSKTGPTYDEGKSWNKNMIARILENAKYTGADSYPKLVDIKLFEAAAEKRQTKQRLPERTPAQKALKRVCSKPPTPEIEQQVMHLLGQAGRTAGAHHAARTNSPHRYIANTQAELDDVLNTQPLDEDAARSLICKLAQEQYDAIGNEEYETERLRRLFTAFECTAELNAELLQSTVSAVLVTHQAVRLQLKNGQIIGKDDLV